MAHNGAKVIHPRAVEIAMSANVPMYIKSTFSDAPGTLITNETTENAGADITLSTAAGVANLSGLTQFRVTLNPNDFTAGQNLFVDLAQAGISVGCLNLSEKEAMFAVVAEDQVKTVTVLDNAGVQYDINEGCGKVTVVGSGMRGVPGVMARFVAALAGNNIKIYQTVDSDNTISAIVKDECLSDAVNALHAAFNL